MKLPNETSPFIRPSSLKTNHINPSIPLYQTITKSDRKHQFMKKSLTNHLIFSILIGFISLISPIRPIPAVRAGEMTGGDYIIKMGTINIKTGTILPVPKESASSFGIGEPFSLTVSTGIVDFGTVKPAAFSGSSLDLTVNGAGGGGYYVSVIEDHPLTTKPD